MYQVLPYIEQENLHQLRQGDGVNVGFIDTGLSEIRVPAFNCPSRSDRFATIATDIYALGDYAGVLASWNDGRWTRFEYQITAPPMENPVTKETEDEVAWTGILVKGGQVNVSESPPRVWKFAKVDFAAIQDGASNTILLAEKAAHADDYTISSSSPWRHWEFWGYYTGADWAIMRMFGAKILRDASPNREVAVRGDSEARTGPFQNGKSIEFGFGSAHPGVLNAVFGDGSAHVLSSSADLLLLDQLGKRADGSIATLEDL